MSSSTIFCNTKLATPPGDPQSPIGLLTIPPNATLPQAIAIINANFRALMPHTLGGRISTRGSNASGSGTNKTNTGGAGNSPKPPPSKGKGAQGKPGPWVLVEQPVNVVRIFQEGNTDNFVDVVRPTSTVLRNSLTGEYITIPGINSSGE